MQQGDEDSGQAPGMRFRFAHAEVDERSRELRVDGRKVAMEAKALEVLLCLLRRPDETLTKDELFAQVWPGRIVTEGTLSKAVMKLRAALSDEGQNLVHTVHGFGYRMGVPVQCLASDAPELFEPKAGAVVPGRANWRLLEALDRLGRGRVWLAEHVKTRDRRVFKFAADAHGLAALKREITLYRLLHDSFGDAAPVVYLFDWNLEEPPFFIESEWAPDGDLETWLAATDEAAPEFAQRIEVIARTAEAVAATHTVGVVHRDLKPANAFVRRHADGSVSVRLGDFGISALSDSAAIEALGITRLGFTRTREGDSSSGTPLYLAPEVIAGQVPTQRSDIYALGVMLYQAVVADPRRPLAPGWERDVEDELLREDIAALADIDPARRPGDAAELARRLRDLEARRRARREQARLREETERVRRDMAHARQRRNRYAAAAAVLLLALAQVQMQRAEDEARRADREAAQANAINDFLSMDLISIVDPWVSGRSQHDTTIQQAIDRARERIGTRFSDQPGVEAALRLRIGLSLRHLDDFDGALEELERALPLADSDAVRAEILLTMTDANLRKGDWRAAIQTSERYLTLDDRADPSRQLLARCRIATALYRLGHREQAIAQLRDLLPQARRSIGNHRVTTAFIMATLAQVLTDVGQVDEALAIQREVVERHVEAYGPDDLLSLSQRRRLGAILVNAGHLDEAQALLPQVYAQTLEKLGADHSAAQEVRRDLAELHLARDEPAQAVALLREQVGQLLPRYGEGFHHSRHAMRDLGRALLALGQREEARDWLQRAHASYLADDGETHPETLRSALELARALDADARIDAAAYNL